MAHYDLALVKRDRIFLMLYAELPNDLIYPMWLMRNKRTTHRSK